MKSSKLFFISNYTADDIMTDMDEINVFRDYSYLPSDLIKTDYQSEKIGSMISRSRIHTIWMAGFMTSEMKAEVRKTDNGLLSNREMYLNEGKEFSRDELIDFFLWLEEAIEDEDKVEK